MEKLKIPYPIIVEGKYDRERILSVCEARVITTDGFGIFKKPEKLTLLRRLSERSRLIVLSDSDGAGGVIRSYIKSAVPADRLIQLYVPQIEGKERRKAEPSREGFLGVEGMERELLHSLLEPFADGAADAVTERTPIVKADLYALGLCGKENSAQRRDELCLRAGLPRGMTPNALLSALNFLYTREELAALTDQPK